MEKELIELKRKEIELMEEQLSQEQSVNLEELVISHSYEMLALITVLEKKGILTRAEIIEVIKELKKSCP